MAELSQILLAARGVGREHEPLWLATVMRVKGSAYRHAGARMLFSSGQVLAGSVSGGCLEAGIVRKGPWLSRERPACISFDGSHEAGDDEEAPRGTGCDGIVDILIERVQFGTPCSPLSVIEDCLHSERRTVLATVFQSNDPLAPVGARLTLDEHGEFSTHGLSGPAWATLARASSEAMAAPGSGARVIASDGIEALLEVIEPPPHLFVIGAGPDARPMVEFATALGFGVTVCETNARVAVRERFAQRASLHVGSIDSIASQIAARRTPVAVVMSHHYPTDLQALGMLLGSRAAYIGMLGPARRTRRMLQEMFGEGASLSHRDRARLRAPIGLDLGAETPAQIALSVIAEVQAVLAHASALPLSEKRRPIHGLVPTLDVPAEAELGKTGTA